MLVSDDRSLREFAVGKILATRNGATSGDTSYRPYRMPDINLAANDLRGLIEWSNMKLKNVEPRLTCHLILGQLMNIVDSEMSVPNYPVHGQSIERCVQSVTRASASVFSEETRDGFMKATLQHRKILSSNDTEKDLTSLLE